MSNELFSTLENLQGMSNRLGFHGGIPQQDRMIKDKRRSLDKALIYSYQGAFVRKLDSEDYVRALINPDKLKQDYDDKIISTGFENEFKSGDVFEWKNTGTYWIVYLQDLTELAYFRGDIRRCRYQIKWQDEDGEIHSTYAAIRGPVETKINSIQKNQISLDVPNFSLNLLMPKNVNTLNYFKRYAKFYLQNLDEGEEVVCWRVEGKDSTSMPGIIELTAVEYYANKDDDDIEEGIVDGLIPEKQEIPSIIIEGNTFIKPMTVETYKFMGNEEPEWSFSEKLPIQYRINADKTISLKWMKSVSGQFDLICNGFFKTIVVESLF